MRRNRKRRNNNLYYQGFFARFKEGFGKAFIFIGIILSFYGWFLGYKLTIVGLLIVAIGIYLCLKGGTQRLNFQRRSGHVIHYVD